MIRGLIDFTRRIAPIAATALGSVIVSAAAAEPYAAPRHLDDPGVTLGGGIIVKPEYEGADSYEVIGYPIIIPQLSGSGDNSLFAQFRRRVSFKGIDDIRFRAFDWNGFEIGPVAGYRTGRDEDDGERLGGLGDIDDGLALGGYVGYRFGTVLLDASATTQATGDDTGVIVRFGAETETQLTHRLKLTTRIGTTFADDEYTETFFGVSAAQAARSTAGLTAFETDAGLKDVFVDVTANMDLSRGWLLQLGGRYARLIGDAADSPVIETEDQFIGRIGLGYKIPLSR